MRLVAPAAMLDRMSHRSGRHGFAQRPVSRFASFGLQAPGISISGFRLPARRLRVKPEIKRRSP